MINNLNPKKTRLVRDLETGQYFIHNNHRYLFLWQSNEDEAFYVVNDVHDAERTKRVRLPGDAEAFVYAKGDIPVGIVPVGGTFKYLGETFKVIHKDYSILHTDRGVWFLSSVAVQEGRY